MVKGNQREQLENRLFVGFTSVQVIAFNPSRSELNKLLGKEDSPNDKEFVYLSTDTKGNDRIRLSFWLYDAKNKRNYIHSFNLTKEKVVSKTGKSQYINSVCTTAYCDSEENLPDWFTDFLDKEKKNSLGTKTYREALLGEAELATTLRTWLGRMSWNDPDSEVMIDTDKLFKEDYSEIRSLIEGQYDTPFVILLGVRTDDKDASKKYQQVYGKAFLPDGFMKYINNGFKFPSDYSKRVWDKFQEDVEGEYGFKSHFKLLPLIDYDPADDLNDSSGTKAPEQQQKQKQNSDY